MLVVAITPVGLRTIAPVPSPAVKADREAVGVPPNPGSTFKIAKRAEAVEVPPTKRSVVVLEGKREPKFCVQ
jgi:hypothetical protein